MAVSGIIILWMGSESGSGSRFYVWNRNRDWDFKMRVWHPAPYAGGLDCTVLCVTVVFTLLLLTVEIVKSVYFYVFRRLLMQKNSSVSFKDIILTENLVNSYKSLTETSANARADRLTILVYIHTVLSILLYRLVLI